MKKLGFVILGALLVIVPLALRGSGGSTMDDYLNEKDGSQTLTVLANKTSVRTLVVGIFSKPQGYYILRNSGPLAKGRYTREQNAYNLKQNDGKEWKLVTQPDDSLRDESGVIWRLKTHAESDATVEENRKACEANRVKDCPY